MKRRLRLALSLLVCALILDEDAVLLLAGAFSPSLALLPPPRHPSKPAGGATATAVSRTRTAFTTHRRRNPRSFESSEGSVVPKSENYGAEDSGLREVYQRVARRDPAWFDTYIVHILDNTSEGENLPALWDISPDNDPEISSQQQKQQPSSSGPSIDELVMELALLDDDFRRRQEHSIAAVAAPTAVLASATATESENVQPPTSMPQEKLDVSPSPALLVDNTMSIVVDRSVDSDLEIEQASHPDEEVAVALEPEAESRAVLQPRVLVGSSGEGLAQVTALMDQRTEVPLSRPTSDSSSVGAVAGAKSEMSKAASTASVSTTASADDRVVVYRDSSREDNEYLTIPFSSLEELGYREADVASLRPEALDLIVKERVPRPRSGVPDRWKRDAGAIRSAKGTSDGDDLVSIVAESDVNAFVEKDRQPRRAQSYPATPSPTKLDLDPAAPGRRSGVSDETNLSRQESLTGRRDTRDAPPREKRVNDLTDRRAPDTRTRGEGRSRPIYSGRPVRRERAAIALQDPPKPSAFWPDIDTFRNLLRDEASLRLRILGNDWAGVVKDESDWRLNLYTQWLWTLHQGVGEPIVESRSDRMRRMSSRTSAAAPTAPGVRKPSSKTRGSSGRERKRQNPETI